MVDATSGTVQLDYSRSRRRRRWLPWVALVLVCVAAVKPILLARELARTWYLDWIDARAYQAWLESNPSFAPSELPATAIRGSNRHWMWWVGMMVPELDARKCTPPLGAPRPNVGPPVKCQPGLRHIGEAVKLYAMLQRPETFELAVGTLANSRGKQQLGAFVHTCPAPGQQVRIVTLARPITSRGPWPSAAQLDLPTISHSAAVTRFQSVAGDPARASFHVNIDGAWTRYDVVLHDDDTLSIERLPEPATPTR